MLRFLRGFVFFSFVLLLGAAQAQRLPAGVRCKVEFELAPATPAVAGAQAQR